MNPLKVAVVGAGYLGTFHAQKYASLPNAELVAVCDIDGAKADKLAVTLDTEATVDPRALLGRVEAVTIAADTAAHYELAKLFLDNGVHVLVEKPMTHTSAEAEALVAIATANGLKLQVGHIERFNPALLAARERLTEVRFIECHRLAAFKPRSMDVDVVLDLMIHDLDVILSLVSAEPSIVSAVGIPVLTDKADIANARIEFTNGAIANVTASRVSTSMQRKFRVFQPNQYVSIDFDAGKIQRVTRHAEWRDKEMPFEIDDWSLAKGDALLAEASAFVDAVQTDSPVQVSGEDGKRALELAEKILDDIARRRR